VESYQMASISEKSQILSFYLQERGKCFRDFSYLNFS